MNMSQIIILIIAVLSVASTKAADASITPSIANMTVSELDNTRTIHHFNQLVPRPLRSAPRDDLSYVALCYHDFIDLRLTPDAKIFPDTLTRDRLVEHFNWLKQQGYHPVSFQQIIDAQTGKAPLPDKAVLLTFDDGYASFYYTVYPLLKLYNFPAVMAIVGHWLEPSANGMVPYGKLMISQKRFLNWEQIKEMQDSGLIEIASHTYNSHYGIYANSFGNEEPAVTSPAYDPKQGRYETLTQYKQRLLSDFEQSRDQMVKHGIRPPRIMVWPYGAYNLAALEVADKVGMTYALSLDEGVNSVHESGRNVKRYLIEQEINLDRLDEILSGEPQFEGSERIVHVDLDYVYSDDPAEMNRNLDILIERIKGAGINTVYLQAFADPDGDGVADALYFQNSYLPVRADLFNRVAWQLKTRAGVKVFAWMPVLGFDLGPNYQYVTDVRFGAPDKGRYLRLSPFSVKNRNAIRQIYRELGAYGKFAGILFHDDAFLTDFEDASPAALQQYRRWGLNPNVTAIREDGEQMASWIQRKTQYLIDFTLDLAENARQYASGSGSPMMLARNIYAEAVLNPASEAWFAQSMSAFGQAYDYTAVMAMPYMEQAEQPMAWLRNIAKVSLQSVPADKLVFELQARNWRTGKPLSSEELAQQMKIIAQEGIQHYGYYPDDFITAQPDLKVLRPVFSNSGKMEGAK
ncbi:poly-beta-1,6-N-acetyl-D-glucosamine N-deacetylase PgaB [Vibrio sp. V39_P1S14PM300]|uniref:poly-beta-1,6-N-acetyl-D-glucosamine N-deacetylase PgaB n=1 Tax=Vibrio sp. V39_P1S14PM300 TaxID=1938690 RepID=UPI001F00F096|nr:poly-beta-1,6-N-acetyl-D-glucosamine N-deacetylase PgaB [Vibrio sp. V39_P1S14PM300]